MSWVPPPGSPQATGHRGLLALRMPDKPRADLSLSARLWVARYAWWSSGSAYAAGRDARTTPSGDPSLDIGLGLAYDQNFSNWLLLPHKPHDIRHRVLTLSRPSRRNKIDQRRNEGFRSRP